MTHICVSPDNCFSPGRHQTIIWTNVGILLVGPLGTNFGEILIETYMFSFKKMHLKISSGKWRLFCVGFNMLTGDNDNANTNHVTQFHLSLITFQPCLVLVWAWLNGHFNYCYDAYQHTETTTWMLFCRQHLEIHFTDKFPLYFDWNFTEVCPYGADRQQVSTGSSHG